MEEEYIKFHRCPVCGRHTKYWEGTWDGLLEEDRYIQCKKCSSIINYDVLAERLKKRKGRKKKGNGEVGEVKED